jgi:predicted metalloprotease with PDZ domain
MAHSMMIILGFFDQALRSTEELPLPELLEAMGVGYRLRAARNSADKGGVAKGDEVPVSQGPVLGATVRDERGDARIAVVFDGGAAQEAGLSAGDVVVAVDGLRVTAGNLEQRIADIPEGYSVSVHAFRRDELMRFDLKPQAPPENICELWLLDDPSEEQLERQQAWLHSR